MGLSFLEKAIIKIDPGFTASCSENADNTWKFTNVMYFPYRKQEFQGKEANFLLTNKH